MKLRVPLFVLLGAIASSCGDDSSLVGIEAESIQLGQGRTGAGQDCSTQEGAGAKGPGNSGTTGGVTSSSSTSTSSSLPSGEEVLPVSPECVGRPNGSLCGDYVICVQERCMPAVCGDGVISPSAFEECEDGNRERNDGCYACVIERCGDGIIHPGEECDDGNNIRDDGCSNLCKRTEKNLCGNGKLDGKEQCDDGNTVHDDACSNLCRLAPSPACGNGKVDNGEACDDGNTRDHDGCSANCQKESCGDGVIRPGKEQCDDGNNENGDGCSATCKSEGGEYSVCGNGIVEPGEQCDDGNNRNTDDCPNSCQAAVCGDGLIEGRETCDDGNTEAGDGCSDTCGQEARCGNGIVEFAVGKEHCDDGGPNPDDPTSNFDMCPDNCRMPVCGDNFRSGPREECDGTDKQEGQTCDENCFVKPVCGNGVVESSNAYPDLSETCDDGNTEGGDGCPANCRGINLAKCGDGVVDEDNGEQCDFGEESNVAAADGEKVKACRLCQWNFFDQACSECVLRFSAAVKESEMCALSNPTPCVEVLKCYANERCAEGPGAVPQPRGSLPCVAGDMSNSEAQKAPKLLGPCLDVAVAATFRFGDEAKTLLDPKDDRGPFIIQHQNRSLHPYGKAGFTMTTMARCADACAPYLRPTE